MKSHPLVDQWIERDSGLAADIGICVIMHWTSCLGEIALFARIWHQH